MSLSLLLPDVFCCLINVVVSLTRKTLVVLDLFYKTSTLLLKLSCNSLLSGICDLTLPTPNATLKFSVSQHFSHPSRDCECCVAAAMRSTSSIIPSNSFKLT